MRIKLATLRKLIREELSRSLVTEGVLSPEYAPDPNHVDSKWMVTYKNDFLKEFEDKIIKAIDAAVRPQLDAEMQPAFGVVKDRTGLFIKVDQKKFLPILGKYMNPDGSLKPGAPEGLEAFVEPYVKRDADAQYIAWSKFHASLLPLVTKVLEGIGFSDTGNGRWSAAIPLKGGDAAGEARIIAFVSTGPSAVGLSFDTSATDSDVVHKGAAAGGTKAYGT